MSKLVYVVMVQKNNGSILSPMVFECAEAARNEMEGWKKDERVLDAWTVLVPVHKKQRVPA